jgi:circadian clock protein KaiC
MSSATRSATRLSTGVAGLDDVLMGGFPQGNVYLIEGDPGVGKTTLALQFLMAGIRDGASVLFVSLSESQRELHAAAASHGWDINDVPILEVTASEDSLSLEKQYSVFHPSEIEFQDTTNTILSKVQETGATRIVFDSIAEIRLLAGDSLRYRRQILALKQFFLHRDCTVLLIDDRRSGGSDMQLESIAHGVLELQSMPRDYGIERRRMRVVKLRGSTYRQGFHDLTIETGGLRIFPRLVASEHRGIMASSVVSSGNAELDALWGGGVAAGTSTLLLGPAGSGKSTIALSYAVAAACRGDRASVFAFDETLGTLFVRAEQLGMRLQEHVDNGRIEIDQLDPAELSPGEFIARARNAVERKQARVIIIDSLNGLLNAMAGEHLMALHLRELCSFLNQRGVATFLVLAQAGIVGHDVSSPVDLSYLADNVLLLRYFEVAGKVRKALSITKKRTGGHEDTLRELRFGAKGIEIGKPLTQFTGVLAGTPVYIGELKGLADAL